MRATPEILGREALVRALEHLAGCSDVRLITLSGLAGVGKTTVADALRTERVWVDASLLDRASSLPIAIADSAALTPPEPGDLDAFAAALDLESRLVVLDGLDALGSPGVQLLGDLLGRCTRTRWLVTSRSPLGLPDEHIVRVDPFPPASHDADDATLRVHPTNRLFRTLSERAGRQLPDDPATLRDVAAIGRRLGGLPLSIELAAARSAAFAPADLLRLLDDAPAPAVLQNRRDGRRDLDGAALVEWSRSLLGPDERHVLDDIAVFLAPVPIEAIAEVADKPLAVVVDAVAGLVDLHLVDAQHETDISTFAVHPLVRDTILALEPADAPRLDELRAAHQAWAVALVTAAESDPVAGTLARAVEPDLVAALHRALDQQLPEPAARLAVGLAPIWLDVGVRTEHVAALTSAGELLCAGSPDPQLTALVHAWRALCRLERTAGVGELDRVVADRDIALKLSECADQRTRARVLHVAAQTTRLTGEFEHAREWCREGLAISERIDEPASTTNYLLLMAMLAHQEHDIDGAVTWGERAFEHARALGSETLMIATAGLLRTLPPDAPITVPVPTATELVAAGEAVGAQRPLLWLRPAAIWEALVSGDREGAATMIVEQFAATARAMSGWTWNAMTMLFVVELAVGEGQPERGARFHGMIAAQLDLLHSTLPPQVAERYGGTVSCVATALGATDFDSIVAQGALVATDAAASEAAAYAADVAKRFREAPRRNADASPLTAREEEVLRCLVDGDTNKTIAARLYITPKTVMHHTSNIYRKLGVRGRSEAVAWAVRRGDMESIVT